MSQFVSEVTDANWASEVLGSDKPVLVDFWAPWCGPCRQIAPSVEAVAEAYKDKVKVVKMNVDENLEMPSKYGVKGIPTLMVFSGGELANAHVGALSQAALAQLVERTLA
ncbi:MAG TPA: thioredoxin [Blastocatellia bacterium]|nr:thioredoxin [Blastocatellia bacterium]